MDADQPQPLFQNEPHSLATLARVSRDIATEPDPVQALWHLVSALREDLHVDRAGIFLYQRHRRTLDRVVGVDRHGQPEFGREVTEVREAAHPLMEVARGVVPHYLSNTLRVEYPECAFTPGVTALAVIPIIVGEELLGILAADNCLRGRPLPEELVGPLFVYAGLSALPLFALYQQQERERTDALRRQLLREVLFAVTSGKIHLQEKAEIEAEWPTLENALPCRQLEDIPAVRDAARKLALQAGMTEERAASFELTAAEASTNALLHGNGGSTAFGQGEGCVRVRVTDHGTGIPDADLPPALLLAGKTSKASAGLGFTLIIENADRLFLNTGPDGTTVIVEMAIEVELKIPEAWANLF